MEIQSKYWKSELSDEFELPYFKSLLQKINEQKEKHRVFPSDELVFNAFNTTDLYNVKVVIIGQDPYHGYGQANGLAFSVSEGVPLPPSLKNIYKEIENEYGYKMGSSGDLTKWARQGVLLLNSSLTVNEGMAASHKDFGWEEFISRVVEILNDKLSEVIFILWGNFAKKYASMINEDKHFILYAAHPSPLSAYNGFFGCNHFKRVNEILSALDKEQIDWKID